MKTYEIILKPLSGFGTPLKGDTLFGHICWQAAYDASLFNDSVDVLLGKYDSNPFLIISSAYCKLKKDGQSSYLLKRPDMPLADLFQLDYKNKKEVMSRRKEIKAKKWMKITDSERIESFHELPYMSDNEVFDAIINPLPEEIQRETRKKGVKSLMVDFTQPHNTINRLTNTTGEGGFAPFTVEQKVFLSQMRLVVFVGIDDNIVIAQVKIAMERIGQLGFGKDASIGLGKFEVSNITEFNLNKIGSETPNACYTLSPSVPEKNLFHAMHFTPFTRFGKHGDILAKSANPFKNPVIMADEGAVLVAKDMRDILNRPYVGTAISNVSKAQPRAVMQGYLLYIPVKVEV